MNNENKTESDATVTYTTTCLFTLALKITNYMDTQCQKVQEILYYYERFLIIITPTERAYISLQICLYTLLLRREIIVSIPSCSITTSAASRNAYKQTSSEQISVIHICYISKVMISNVSRRLG